MIRIIGLAILLAWAFTSSHLGLAIEYMVGRTGEHLMSHVEVLVRLVFSIIGLGRHSVDLALGMRHLTFVQILTRISTQIAGSALPARAKIAGDNASSTGMYDDTMSAWFFYLALFKYLALVVHIVSFDVLYTSTSTPRAPNIQPNDCTVIIPIEDPENPVFAECLQSCLTNEPALIMIVTTGEEVTVAMKKAVARYQQQYTHTKISVKTSSHTGRRNQIAYGLEYAKTKITILMDEHVAWPSARFLPALIAPFEDRRVGIVGTNKRARRTDGNYIFNALGAMELERQCFDERGANAIDGGVFIVSDLTSAHRTRIVTEDSFLDALTNKRFFFGTFAPLSTDADSFITRWTLACGYSAKIQSSSDACIETVLPPNYIARCIEQSRTSWRTSFAYLFSIGPRLWTHPWSFYALHLSSVFNLALLYDGVLIYTLSTSPMARELNALSYLIRWMLVTKLAKLIPYFVSHPQDLLMLPAVLAFGYIHSLIKIYAGLTFFITTTDPNTRKIYPEPSGWSSVGGMGMGMGMNVGLGIKYPSSPGQASASGSGSKAAVRSRSRIRGDDWDSPGGNLSPPQPRGRGRPRSETPLQSVEEDVYASPGKRGAKPRGRPKKK